MVRASRIALVSLALLALLLAGFYAYIRWDNYNALRDLIAARVERATGQQLSFNGPVSLEMGTDSFLNFRDVVLTNPDWQMIRSTITVDEGRIGLDVPNVVAGGIGTVVQLNTVRVELDRPEQAADMPVAPPPGTVLSAPDAPPLPKFDELRAERVIVIARNLLGQRELQLEQLQVAPETDQRTRMKAAAAGSNDVTLSILTDQIDNGRAWTLSVNSPRTQLGMVVEASAGRKLTLRGVADASVLDVSDLNALLPEDPVKVVAEQKPFFDTAQPLPIGWLKLIKANLDVRLSQVTAGDAFFAQVRLEGRADNGWISFAPFEVKGAQGSMRGFTVFNAASLPADLDISVTADGFAPFPLSDAQLDGRVRLAGSSSTFAAVKRPDGEVALFSSNLKLSSLAKLPVLTQVLPALMQTSQDGALARCAVLKGPVAAGRMRALSGQLYANAGRLALRGTAGLFEGLVDIEAVVQPSGEKPSYVSAVGSLNAPAIASGKSGAPWLKFDLPQERVCALLRQQFEISRTGR